MDDIELYHLHSTNRYSITRAKQSAEWPGMLVTSVNRAKQAFALAQRPTFVKNIPVKFATWAELLQSPPPRPPLNIKRKLVLAGANFPFPVSCSPPFNVNERMAWGKAFQEEAIQSARTKAAKEDLGNSAMRTAFLIMTGAGSLMTMIFVFVVAKSVWFPSGEGAAQQVVLPPAAVIARQRGRDWLARMWAVTAPAAARGFDVYNRWLYRQVDALQRYLQARAAERALKRETIIVYDSQVAHLVSLPSAEIQSHLHHLARFTNHSLLPYAAGAMGGWVAASVLFFVVWLWVGLAPTGAAVFAMMCGVLFGAGPGLLVGPRFGPKPFWVMRRRFEDAEPDKKTGEIQVNIVYESVTPADISIQEWAYVDEDGQFVDPTVSKAVGIKPQVYRATTTYEKTLARDERDLHTSHGNKWEKIQLGLTVVWIASIGALLILLGAVMENK